MQAILEQAQVLPRRHIAARIDPPEGGGALVTTMVAPAGYGKTTLLRSLAARNGGLPSALFIALGQCENHVGLFLDALIAALQETLPRADARSLLAFKKTVPAEEYGLRLPYVLSRVVERAVDGAGSDNLVLLLDDVQLLRPGEPLAELLAALLREPSLPIRYVLASRQSIPFDLSVHRQAGTLVELTSQELEFTPGEVQELLAAHVGRDISPAIAERVWARTHGWAGGLGLLLMLARDTSPEELAQFLDGLSGSEGPLVDFVVQRLLQEQRPQVQYFMKVVSVLERVDHEVVTALFASQTQGHRGSVEGRRAFIQLPERELATYLRMLEESQILVQSAGHPQQLRFNPLVGAALRGVLAREDVVVYREAHRRAAQWHLDKGGEIGPAALDHLVEAEDYERLMEVLEHEAERFFTAGYHRHLSQWLIKLEARYATLPLWASYYLGRVYSMLGEWDKARGYLDRCKRALSEREREGDLWRWHPRLCLGYASMYWRRGMQNDASTYCRRGLDYLRQLERRGAIADEQRVETVGLQLALLNLLGTLKLEAGAYDKAAEVFSESLALAREAGLSVEAATALKNLGVIATRRGDVAAGTRHYEEAMGRIQRDQDVELYGMLAFQLGFNHLILGRYDEARQLLEEALAIRLDTGHPGSITQTLTALGQLHAAAGQPELADRAYRRAVRMLESVGNLKMRAETLDRYAAFLASAGKIHESQSMYDRAEGLIGGLLRSDASLVALHRESAMELMLARGRPEDALANLSGAIERYEKLGERYHVSRLYWRAAGIHHRLFLEERRGTPESVVSYLELACAEANRQGWCFGLERRFRELILVGRALGHPEAMRYCQRMLERIDAEAAQDDPIACLPDAAAQRYNRFQQRFERDDEYVVTTRDGRSGASDKRLDEILTGRGAHSLIVLADRQEMVNYGQAVALGQKRVILPLLVHFLTHPDRTFTMNELATEVWGVEDESETLKTKVKVAISRLRTLLGKGREYVQTGRRQDGERGSLVTYGLAPNVEYYLFEPARRE